MTLERPVWIIGSTGGYGVQPQFDALRGPEGSCGRDGGRATVDFQPLIVRNRAS